MEFTFYLLLTKIEIYFCFFNFFKLFTILFTQRTLKNKFSKMY